jgi:hypothetical protein
MRCDVILGLVLDIATQYVASPESSSNTLTLPDRSNLEVALTPALSTARTLYPGYRS